jgi:hypothetical protein
MNLPKNGQPKRGTKPTRSGWQNQEDEERTEQRRHKIAATQNEKPA